MTAARQEAKLKGGRVDGIADWRRLVMSRWAVPLAWGLYVLVRLAVLPLTGTEPHGADDYTRMLEVRALLDGQSWWDVTQYRMNPPQGASMHWSRLVDLPLAGVAALFGETAAMVAVPLLWLLPALYALRSIMQCLGFGPLAMLFGLVVLPLFPLLPGNFAPMRIDHHAPQAVLALSCAALMLAGTRMTALFAGGLAAAWLAISIEGLPVVALIAALYGLRYWLDRERNLAPYLVGLAVCAPLLSLATRPVSAFAASFCDILLPGHMLAFTASAAIAATLPFLPGQGTARGRLLGLAAIPVVAAPIALAALGECAANPFAQLDPLLQTYWHGHIVEGLPVWRQPLSTAAMLLWTPMLVLGGWWIARSAAITSRAKARVWHLLTLLALGACLYSLLLMREGVVAQLLAVPFGAFLLAHYLPQARALQQSVPRILATLACFLLLTPTFASAVAKPWDRAWEGDSRRGRAMALTQGPACDYTRLAELPAGLVFTTLDAGPDILFHSPHAIHAASYHRNEGPMRDVIKAFVSDPATARRIVTAADADYVVSCLAEGDLALYRTVGPANFANLVTKGEAPSWLSPLPGFTGGSLRVWRVR
jgi:hypothetical protein